MACNITPKFGNVSHYGYSGPLRMLEKNLKYFLDWAFLCIGAWTDITLGIPTPLGTDASLLRARKSAIGYADGRVWDGFRKDWVYETGVVYTDTDNNTHSPLVPQVYVGGVLQNPSTYKVDYVNGSVIFNAPISLTSVVQAVYSFRNVQTYIGGENDWWQELQRRSWDVDDEFFRNQDCGIWVIGNHHRVQMPAIIIDFVPTGVAGAAGLGDCSVKREQEIEFYILAEDKCTRDRLLDILLLQNERCFNTFQFDDAAVGGDIPLDCNNFLVGTKNYLQILQDYPWTNARFSENEITSAGILDCKLYEGVVKSKLTLWCI